MLKSELCLVTGKATDLICGAEESCIAPVFERQTHFTAVVKVNNKETKSAVNAPIRQMTQ